MALVGRVVGLVRFFKGNKVFGTETIRFFGLQ
jgi:hypothetical protein